MEVTGLTNIGKGLEKLLAEVEIYTAEDFLANDPTHLYIKQEEKHPGLHLAVLAAFIGAHSGTPWYYIYRQTKKDYLAHR